MTVLGGFPALTPDEIKARITVELTARLIEAFSILPELQCLLPPERWPEIERWQAGKGPEEVRAAIEHLMLTDEFPPPQPLTA